MNAGIHDAYHLADAICEEADGALDHYAEFRRAWARRFLLADTGRTMGEMEAHWPWTRFFRNQATTAAVATEAKERAYLLRVSMFGDLTAAEERGERVVSADLPP